MKRLFLLLFLMLAGSVTAQTTAYTEFYCNSTGTNINAGSTTNAAATYSGDAGNWTNATSTFYLSGADLSGVTVGMWASVWTNATAPTNAVYIGRIIAVSDVDDTIQLSTTAVSGTLPGTNVGATSIRVGGAWRGAYGTVAFPFAFITGAMTNVSYNTPRINFQSGYSNSITAAIVDAIVGPRIFSGYTSTPGDGGMGILDGGNGDLAILRFNGNRNQVHNFIIQNTLNNQFNHGLYIAGESSLAFRCIIRNTGGCAVYVSGNYSMCIECEGYKNNRASNANYGAFYNTYGYGFIRCYAHEGGSGGFSGLSSFEMRADNCLAVSNYLNGFAASGYSIIRNCDSISNRLNGIYFTGADSGSVIENCNLIGNRSYGIAFATNVVRPALLLNNWFGSGTKQNVLGNFSPNIGVTNSVYTSGNNSYSADLDPYVNSSGLNFSLTNTAASYGQGRGSFLDIEKNGGIVGYPSVGAAAGTNAVGNTTNITITGSGGATSHTFSQ
jgi:hypothetical protein